MKKILLILITGSLLISSCKKYLDINSDPDTPQNPDPTSVMLAMYPAAADAVQFDGMWLGAYSQMFHARSSTTALTDALTDFDRHGYNSFTADRAARYWRQAYYGLGKNLEYCISEGTRKTQWTVVGAAQALKVYMFLSTTNVHGEIIWNDAFKEDSIFFRYDNQDAVYRGLDSLSRVAIYNLSRGSEVNPATQPLSRGDYIYNGDAAKWTKFVYGLQARMYNALTSKPQYISQYADSVIKFTGLSMSSGADDFLIPHDASRNADANIFGTFRDNLSTARQSDYIVRLLDGRVFTGAFTNFANRDPRISHMLSASADTSNGNGGYRGSIAGSGDLNNANANTRIRVPVLWGDSLNANPGAANFAARPGKYLFQNKAVVPLMTYSEIQFMRAEAYLRKSNATSALTAYQNGIIGHFDFINRGSYPRSNVILYNTVPISAAQRATYLASGNVKQTAATLTLGDILQQKFIALWGWGFVESWVDQRKVHYTDIDPATPAIQIYSGMVVPTVLFIDNGPLLVQRVRPRYNSEYVWNIYRPAITNLSTFHVIPCWFSQP